MIIYIKLYYNYYLNIVQHHDSLFKLTNFCFNNSLTHNQLLSHDVEQYSDIN